VGQKRQGKASAVNGKVSNSIKTTWTLNKCPDSKTISRINNQSIMENADDMQE